MSVWKITQTKDPAWIAVIGPYDDDFIADMCQVRRAYFHEGLRAWLAPASARDRVEVIIEKYSPPPRVELLAGLEASVPDLAEGLALAGLEVEHLRTVEVEGKVLVVAVARRS